MWLQTNEICKITIRLDSEFVAVFAEPNDRKTVKAAAKCLNASVSGPAQYLITLVSTKQLFHLFYKPPPATENSCRSSSIEQCVFPAPDVPDKIMAWGYPVSAC